MAPNTKTKLFPEIAALIDQENSNHHWSVKVPLQITNDSIARIYMESKRAAAEFPEKIVGSSLARKALDPNMEAVGLVNSDDELKLLMMHPFRI